MSSYQVPAFLPSFLPSFVVVFQLSIEQVYKGIISSSASIIKKMTQCEFPLFRQRFWANAQWTEDTSDSMHGQEHLSQSQTQQCNNQTRAAIKPFLLGPNSPSLYVIDENLDLLRSVNRTPSSTNEDKIIQPQDAT
eukprot:TRINITY_DN26232_c0_g1_i1.p4 TRINITY_DN26232_c0_g1~~TRINITY_DN26232_c0_g1_i1.p4  ORF type:complete len:136 (-),score=2.38 TRINITY_DN26232_c0_g1_i1:365-772(-)